MLHFKEELVNRKQFLENLIHETKKRLETAPKGSLRVSQSEGSIQFFYRRESSDRRGIYLKKREHSLASELAQKDYDQKICEAAEKELKAIQKCLKSYPPSFFRVFCFPLI